MTFSLSNYFQLESMMKKEEKAEILEKWPSLLNFDCEKACMGWAKATWRYFFEVAVLSPVFWRPQLAVQGSTQSKGPAYQIRKSRTNAKKEGSSQRFFKGLLSWKLVRKKDSHLTS